MDYLETVTNKKAERKETQHKEAVLNAFNGLSTDIRVLLDSLEKTGAKKLDKDFIDSVKALEEVASTLKEVKITSDDDIKNGLKALASAFSHLNVRPVVNVAPPKVEVIERDIDFKPLIDKLNTPVKVQSTATEYKAQDMDETTDPNKQFVGFVDPTGCWYIIENDTLMNSLRYKFGKRSYAQAWNNRTKHTYKLYNEALNEVSA